MPHSVKGKLLTQIVPGHRSTMHERSGMERLGVSGERLLFGGHGSRIQRLGSLS